MAKLGREEIFKALVSILDELREDWEYSGEITMKTAIMHELEFESIDVVALGEVLEEHYQQSLPFAAFFAELGEREVEDIYIADVVEFLSQNLGEK